MDKLSKGYVGWVDKETALHDASVIKDFLDTGEVLGGLRSVDKASVLVELDGKKWKVTVEKY